MAVDREKLYEQVWDGPMTKVAAQYGVSSSFLARVCERLNVPRPARGYWARLAVGKAPTKPALQEARPGDELEWSRDGEPRRVPRALPKVPGETAQTSSRPRRTRSTRHPLVVGAREHFEGAKESEGGYLRPSKRRLVDVFVSQATLDRALKAANTLFLALEDRGHQLAFAPLDQHLQRPEVDERSEGGRDRYGSRWRPDRATVVYVGTVAIGLTIFELSDEIEVQYVDGKYVPVSRVPVSRRAGLLSPNVWIHKRDTPSGKLCLRASSPYPRATWEKQWREAKRGDLPSKIPQIVQELESEAVTIARLVEEGQRQAEIEMREWEVQQEKWRREEAERRRVQNIKEAREQLFAIIEAWGVATRIEGFFADAERRATSLGDEERAIVVDRLQRARSLLGGVDALQRFVAWKVPEER